jgi:hypothetical protein
MKLLPATTESLSVAGVVAPALEQRKIASAPGENGKFVSRRWVIAVAVAEIPVIVLADFASSSHEISAPVVFANQQVMVPSRFVGRLP